MELDYNWQTLHSDFTSEQIQSWQSQGFDYTQTQDWINTDLQPTDHSFAAYLRDQKQLTPETVLNQANYEQLKAEYENHQLETKQELPPK